MINLPAKFAAENAKAENIPAVIVKLLDSEIANEQTTQTHWGANSAESNVDYTPDPPTSGDVILASPGLFEQSTVSNAWSNAITINTLGLQVLNDHWQSFKHTTSTSKPLLLIKAFLRQSGATDPAAKVDIKCELWSAGKGGVLVGPKTFTQVLPPAGGQWYSFDFTADAYVIDPNTEYWVRIYLSNATSLNLVVDAAYQNTDVYANGQLDRTGTNPATNLGDLKFSVSMDNYYQASGYITTQTMDMGAVPTVVGEVILKDIRPAGTSIVYEGWKSSTGAFTGEEVYVGILTDGQKIPLGALARYYRVKATLSATDRSFTPTLLSIKASFATYTSYSNIVGFGYEPAVVSISNLSTTIDTFEPYTIGQMTIRLSFIKSLSDWMKTKYPKNKIVKILVGFKAEGFTELDFIDFFWGQVDDWAISSKDEVTLTIKDFKKEWNVDVPSKWETTLDDVTWTAMHHVDVILDLLQNHVNVRDSKLDISSFDILRTTLSGWQVTRTITNDPEQANALIEELRVLMSAFFIPKADGKISIKRWDPNEAAVVTLIDDKTDNKKWSANAKSIVNNLFVYINNDGLGNDAANYTDIRLGSDVASQVNYDEFASKTIKDKWTRVAQASQADDLINQVLTRYADPPELIKLRTDSNLIALEVGDLVNLSMLRAPSSDMSGIVNVKYQIVRRNINFQDDIIDLRLLRV